MTKQKKIEPPIDGAIHNAINLRGLQTVISCGVIAYILLWFPAYTYLF